MANVLPICLVAQIPACLVKISLCKKHFTILAGRNKGYANDLSMSDSFVTDNRGEFTIHTSRGEIEKTKS